MPGRTERTIPTNRFGRSADIVPFIEQANHFTVADRITLLHWEQSGNGVRLAIHKRRHDDPPEVGEFASIYPLDAPWAAWGAARHGQGIRVWRAKDGRDIGNFATMVEALAAVTGPAAAMEQR